jgi:hypothetical protein
MYSYKSIIKYLHPLKLMLTSNKEEHVALMSKVVIWNYIIIILFQK